MQYREGANWHMGVLVNGTDDPYKMVWSLGPHGVAFSRAEHIIATILCVSSMILSSFIITIAGTLWYLDKARNMTRRCSVRMLLYSEALNIPLAMLLLLHIVGGHMPPAFCVWRPYVITVLWTIFSGLSAYISVNLVCVLVFKLTNRHEQCFLFFLFVISIAAPMPALFLDYFGFDRLHGTCWLRLPAGAHRNWVTFGSMFIIPLFFAITSFGASAWIVWYLRYNTKTKAPLTTMENGVLGSTAMIIKVLIFPTTGSFLSMAFCMATILADHPNKHLIENWPYRFTASIAACLPAIVLGLELIMVDPSINLRIIKKSLLTKRTNISLTASPETKSTRPTESIFAATPEQRKGVPIVPKAAVSPEEKKNKKKAVPLESRNSNKRKPMPLLIQAQTSVEMAVVEQQEPEKYKDDFERDVAGRRL